jgi:hypothetical protein
MVIIDISALLYKKKVQTLNSSFQGKGVSTELYAQANAQSLSFITTLFFVTSLVMLDQYVC